MKIEIHLKKFFSILVTVFIVPYAFSQYNGKFDYNGIICDSVDLKPLPFSTIFLQNFHDSTLQFSAIADEIGVFHFKNLPSGNFTAQFRYLGYQSKGKLLNFSEQKKDVDTILLIPKLSILSEVEIKTSIYERSINKLTMNTSLVNLPPGSNVVDLLKEVPGVYISSDNNLTLLGKEVMIFLDGKPMRISFDKLSNMLKNQSSNDISKIEIMTTPPPKYVDEWSGGLLNIISKKNLANGSYGTISNLIGYGKHFREEFSFDINYRRSHSNTYLLLGPRWSKKETSTTTTQRSIEQDKVITLQNGVQNYSQKGGYLTAGTSYFPNKRNTIELTYNGSIMEDLSGLTDDIIVYPENFNDSVITSSSSANRKNISNEINLYYRNIINNDQNLTVEGDITRSEINYYQNLNYNYSSMKPAVPVDIEETRNSSNYKTNIIFLRIDHAYETKKIKIESGIKWNFTRTDNNIIYENLKNDYWTFDSTKSNNFILDENIYSIYTSIGQQLTPKFGYLVGLRLAYTTQQGNSKTLQQSNSKSYLNFLPSLYLGYSINENHEISLNYDRTLDRPYFESMNPFVYYDNPLSFTQGNPFLNPSVRDKIMFSYRFKTLFFASVSYRYRKDMITLRPVIDKNSNIIIGYKYENFDVSNKYAFSCTFSKNLYKKKLKMNINPECYFLHSSNTELSFKNDSWNYSFLLYISYTIHEKTGLEIGFYDTYYSGMDEGYNEIIGANKCGVGISGFLFNNKFRWGLELNDIFNSESNNYKITLGNLEYITKNSPDSRYLRLNLSYSFSAKKVEQYDRHNPYNEEKERIK